MKTINLEDALQRQPFKPFVVHLDSGKEISVRHPEMCLFTESKQAAVVVEGEHVHVIDINHISSLND